MANDSGKYYPARKFMPGAPLPSLQTRATECREFSLSRGQEFTVYLQHYLTDTFSPQSGARGIHLNKLQQSDENSHAYIYEVNGVPLWGHGMDYDTAGTGRSDYIPVFDNSANAGSGADVFRWSGEADAPAGTSLTCKLNAGRVVGSPRANTSFATFSGGDNATGLGGMSVSFWDESGTFNALALANRSTNKKRTLINLNSQYLLGTDLGNANAQNFTLYDNTGLGSVFAVDNTGLVTHYFKSQMDGSLAVTGTSGATEGIAVTAPTLGRCLTLNAGAGATIYMNPPAGTKRNSLHMGGTFQWGTDINNNGGGDFWFQNLTTGNIFLTCDVNDRTTIGSSYASGGAILGVSGGYASFYGATPVLQPAGTTDVLASLVTLGLRAASSNPPLNLGTGYIIAGNGQFSGTLGIGGSAASGLQCQITAATSTTIGLVVEGAASQSADLQDWRNSSGATVAYVGPAGAFSAAGGTLTGGTGTSLTLQNTTGAGLVLLQTAAGTKRVLVDLNNVMQYGTDLANNGTADFWWQNIGTGNIVLSISSSDLTTIGSSSATGGAVLGVSGGKIATYGAAPVTKQTVTGAKGGNVALANLMTALAALGLVTDSTT